MELPAWRESPFSAGFANRNGTSTLLVLLQVVPHFSFNRRRKRLWASSPVMQFRGTLRARRCSSAAGKKKRRLCPRNLRPGGAPLNPYAANSKSVNLTTA
jgi:hypothetical protein